MGFTDSSFGEEIVRRSARIPHPIIPLNGTLNQPSVHGFRTVYKFRNLRYSQPGGVPCKSTTWAPGKWVDPYIAFPFSER